MEAEGPVHNNQCNSLPSSDEMASNEKDIAHLDEDNAEFIERQVPEMGLGEVEHISLGEDDPTSPNGLVNMLANHDIPNLLAESLTDAMENPKSISYPPQRSSLTEEINFEHLNQSDLASCIPTSNSPTICQSTDTTRNVDVVHTFQDDRQIMLKPPAKVKQGRGRPKKQSNCATASAVTVVSSDMSSSLGRHSETTDHHSGKINPEGVTLNSMCSEDVDHPKKKRGRPPKLKADSLCARTVPYGWKSKTREQRLADFKLLLSQCEDVEPERNASASSESVSQQASSCSGHLTLPQSNESCVLHAENTAAEQDIALSDNRDFQRPHVSPDSGISAGGSPAHVVASPHHILQHPVGPEDSTVQDGPPTLEPMVFTTGPKSTLQSINTITSSPLCDSNSQTLFSKYQSSHKNSMGFGRSCDQTNLSRTELNKKEVSKVYQSGSSDSHSSVNAPDGSVKRKRGRPKGSGLSLKASRETDSTKTPISPVISPGSNVELQVSPLQMPFTTPYMNPYNYVMPQSSTSQMAEYLDNIFERFQAEQSSAYNKSEPSTSDVPFESCSSKPAKQKPSGESETVKKHRLSNNIKLSKNAKSAIKSKLSRALKLSGFSRDMSFKKKRGRPRIHPLPVENLKRGRGRPRKYPMSSQTKSSTSVPDKTQSSRKPSSYKTLQQNKLKSKQYVPNPTQGNHSGMKFCHPVSKVSFGSTHSNNGNEAEGFNIGPPVLFSEESLSPEAMPLGKPGDEFDKLMHSLQPVHARISAKFHRRLSEMDRTEDTVSSDSECELATSQTQSDLLKENKKLVPNIRKAKLQVTPPKKRGRKKKTIAEHSELFVDPECQTEFSLPPSAYAFHKMSSCGMSKDTPLERASDTRTSGLSSHSVRCNSPLIMHMGEGEHSRGLPKSPPAHLSFSPGSQAGSTVSALSRLSEELHEGKRKGNKRKKSKHFKSKHKNIVDPVFVAEVENLAGDIESIKLSDLQQPHTQFTNRTDSPMSVPVVFHFGKRTSKALLKATSRPQKCFKSKSVLNQFRKARKRRQIQDGLDMARKKHILLKKKARISDQVDDVVRRPRGRPRKTPVECSNKQTPDKDRLPREGYERSEDETSICDNEIYDDEVDSFRHHEPVMRCDPQKSSKDKNNEATVDVNSQPSCSVIKRKPGRPRKNTAKSKESAQKHKLSESECVSSSTVVVDQETCTNSTSRIVKASSQVISVQTDFEVQCDLESEVEEEEDPPQPPAKTTVDVGIQVDPQELKRLAASHQKQPPTQQQSEKAEIGIQVQNENSNEGSTDLSLPVTQPLEIQVNFDDISDHEEDEVNLLSEASRSSSIQLTPRRCSPRRLNHEAEVSKSAKSTISDSADFIKLTEAEDTMLPQNVDMCESLPKDNEKKSSKSHKKKGKSRKKDNSKGVKVSVSQKQNLFSIEKDVEKSIVESEKESTTPDKPGKVLSPKNIIDKRKSPKGNKPEVDHFTSCPNSGFSKSPKRSKNVKTMAKEQVEDITTGKNAEIDSQKEHESVSKSQNDPQSTEMQATKPKSPDKCKQRESVEETLSPNSVAEKFVESVTAAAKCGAISEISYEDFCKENEGDTQQQPEPHSGPKSKKKRSRSASGRKISETEVPKPLSPSSKAQTGISDSKTSETQEKKDDTEGSMPSPEKAQKEPSNSRDSKENKKEPEIPKPSGPSSKGNKIPSSTKSSEHQENKKGADASKSLPQSKAHKSGSSSKSKGHEESSKEADITKPSLPSTKAHFQAAFESFISSSTPAQQLDCEDDQMESFFDGNEDVPFPAPETVDLTDGADLAFSADTNTSNILQDKEATCDEDNPTKSKSKKGTKSLKKKKNHTSINKVKNKDIEIIEHNDLQNTQVSTEECLVNDVEKTCQDDHENRSHQDDLENRLQGGDLEKGSHEVIVLSESEDEDSDKTGCPDCAKLQRACRGGRRNCRHRSNNLTKELSRERKFPNNLSPLSANSHKSHSGTDSDRECVVILERLDASRLPKTPQDTGSTGESNQKPEHTQSSASSEMPSSMDNESPEHSSAECETTNDVAEISPCDNENTSDNEIMINPDNIQPPSPEMEANGKDSTESRNKKVKKKNKSSNQSSKSKQQSNGVSKNRDFSSSSLSARSRQILKHNRLSSLKQSSKRKERVDPAAVVHNIDDSEDETNASSRGPSHVRDTSPVMCTILKRKNTNSDYEPLPVMKKKRKLQNDMGYSQPKRRRRRKSTASTSQPPALSSTAPLSIEIETIDLSLYDSSQDENASQTESESVMSSRPGTPARKALDGPQLPRKRYQRAGLFSSAYKGNDVKRKKQELKNAVYDPSELEFGLMPAPIHVGKYLREKRIDFSIPYDIWWMQEHNMLKPVKMLSPKYKKIRNNVYVDCRPVCKYETHPCNCRKPSSTSDSGCGENCLNRMIYTECNPSTCPCKDQCSNQRFQKHEEKEGLEKFGTHDRGHGVHCNKEIPSGAFVIEYVGEVITEGEFQERMTEEYANDRHHYCLNLDSGLVIDGYRMGNLSRFVNHSCDPNCEMQKWNVNGVYRMGLFANQEIEPGTELTYDYNFHSYNLDAQQECRCGSEKCRGVLGGKAGQKLNGILKEKWSQPTNKDKDKTKPKAKKKDKDKEPSISKPPSQQSSPMKPLSHRERCVVQKRAIFLLRNLSKVRQVRRHKSEPATPTEEGSSSSNPFMGRMDPTPEQDSFHTQLMALNTARTVKTRGLSVAQDNEEVSRFAQLAQIFQIIFVSVQTFKGDNGEVLSVPLQQCPNRKKHPEYYQMIEEPIDLNTIEQKVTTGQYKSLEAFEGEFLRLFKNVEKYCGKKSEIGQAVSRLKKVFYTAKTECLPGLEELLGESPITSAPSECSSLDTNEDKMEEGEEEEVIRCVCNIYRDEGVMIQCEKCERWQHADCMGEPDVEKYMCEECDPRPLSKEVLMKPPPDDAKPECTYYLTLLRDSLQVRVGDAVYIVKDTNLVKTDGIKVKLDYDDLSKDTCQLDIFRVETLWKNESGEKFAFGHHYLRPHETFHEPNRKFFENEVFRIPLYEIVPLEAIVTNCVVMDLSTYCKGRPRDVNEKDVYICEYRIDKNARMFNKIGKPKYPINTKTYCFDRFSVKMYPKRTYSPHEVPDQYKKRAVSRLDSDQVSESGRSVQTLSSDPGNESDDEDLPLAQLKRLKTKKKKRRLNVLCEKLLSRKLSKQEESRGRPDRGKRAKVTLETLFPS